MQTKSITVPNQGVSHAQARSAAGTLGRYAGHHVRRAGNAVQGAYVKHSATKTGKVVLISLGVVSLGIITYVILHARNASKQVTKVKNAPDESTMQTPAYKSGNVGTNPSTGQTYTPPTTESFPLNVGMSGDNVKALQNAGITKYNYNLAYGADGNFGAKTAKMVTDLGFTVPVSQNDYNAMLQGMSVIDARLTYGAPASAPSPDATAMDAYLKRTFPVLFG